MSLADPPGPSTSPHPAPSSEGSEPPVPVLPTRAAATAGLVGVDASVPRLGGGAALPGWSGRRWSRRARLAGYVGVAVLAVAGSTMIYAVDPAEPGHYPTCPFKLVTGLDCPGCGSMRGLHQLLHGHLGHAANYNILLIAAAPYLVIGWLVSMTRLLGGPQVRLPRMPVWLYKAIPVLVVAFWIVRNIPGPVGVWLHS